LAIPALAVIMALKDKEPHHNARYEQIVLNALKGNWEHSKVQELIMKNTPDLQNEILHH
jgi:hypothetical protein